MNLWFCAWNLLLLHLAFMYNLHWIGKKWQETYTWDYERKAADFFTVLSLILQVPHVFLIPQADIYDRALKHHIFNSGKKKHQHNQNSTFPVLNNNRLQKHYVPVLLTFRTKKSEGASVFRMAPLPFSRRKRRLVTVTKFSFKYQFKMCLHPWVIHINFSGQKVVFHYLSLFTQSISCGQSKLGFLLSWPFIHSNSLAGQQETQWQKEQGGKEISHTPQDRHPLGMKLLAKWSTREQVLPKNHHLGFFLTRLIS